MSVPSDAAASYRVLANDETASGRREIVTRRDGREGTRYDRWELDCARAAFRQLGQGDTVVAALARPPQPGRFKALEDDRVVADIARHTCTD